MVTSVSTFSDEHPVPATKDLIFAALSGQLPGG
jgi:hypothetical protein